MKTAIGYRLSAIALAISCGGKPPPPTRFYELPAPTAATTADAPTLVIEPLVAEGAYDDERMVYRASPYRLDYYDYHRWGAPPGQLVASYLEHALQGSFHTVATPDDRSLVLGGRITALEEVDASKTKWVGHVALELALRDASGKVVWTGQFDESVPMPTQSPEGLARAITTAMQRIAQHVAPKLEVAVRPGRTPARPVTAADRE